MKKHRYLRILPIVIGVAVLAAALAFCALTGWRDMTSSVSFSVAAGDSSERVSLFRSGDTDCVFLPSYAEPESLSLVCPAGSEVYIDGERYTGEGFFSELSFGREYNMSVKNSLGLTVYSGRLMFMRSENIAALSLTLIDGELEDVDSSSNKAVSKTGTCTLITSDGSIDYMGSFDSFSGRGNSTWLAYKKPYNLRFKESTSLLSMKSAEKYCLLANAYDTSSLRDKIAYEAAADLGLSYSVDSRFVDLYVNSEYLGLYLMTQSVEAGEGRQVEIADLEEQNAAANSFALSKYDSFSERGEDTLRQGYELSRQPDDISGGYLVETDLENRLTDEDCYFQLSADELFHIKSPAHASRGELDYIAGIFEKISSGENLSDLIDIDSWTGLFLIKEFFGDTEGSSLYFHKRSGDDKIYGGPVWDCDLTMGLAWKATIPPDFLFFTSYGIMGKVYGDQTFREALINRYSEALTPLIEDILSEKADAYADEIRASYAMDKLRWSEADKPGWVVVNDSLDEDVAEIKEYISGRREFLDSVWLDSEEYSCVHCISEVSNDDNPLQYYITVTKGSELPELPEPEDEDYDFEGWYLDTEYSQPAEAGMTVSEDLTLRAKWSLKQGGVIGKLKQALRRYLEYGSVRELAGIAVLLALIGVMALTTLILVIKEIRERRAGG